MLKETKLSPFCSLKKSKKSCFDTSCVYLTGSAADVQEVQACDELLEINGRDVGTLTLAQVQGIVDHAVKRGQIELKIKRVMDDGKTSLYVRSFRHRCLLI